MHSSGCSTSPHGLCVRGRCRPLHLARHTACDFPAPRWRVVRDSALWAPGLSHRTGLKPRTFMVLQGGLLWGWKRGTLSYGWKGLDQREHSPGEAIM